MVFLVTKIVKGKKYYSLAKYKKGGKKGEHEIIIYLGSAKKILEFYKEYKVKAKKLSSREKV